MPKAAEQKKGKPTWKPANRLQVRKEPGWRYRMCSKEEANIAKKQAEGWQYVNTTTGIPGEHERPDGVGDGNNLDSAFEYRDLVLMAMPEELAQAREEHYQQITQKQVAGLKKQVKSDVEKAARQAGVPASEITGNITIIE